MKKLIIYISFVLFAVIFLNPVKNVFSDVPGNINHHHNEIKKDKKKNPNTNNNVLPDTSQELDTTNIKDTINNKEYQDNLNFFELMKPQHIAVGGAVFFVVIFSFVILSKVRNKK